MSTPRIEGLENPATLDAIAHDAKRDVIILAMYETRPWTHGDAQLLQLQEKLNAYASYALDGEMAEDYPEFRDKKIRIQLRTAHDPSDRVLEFVMQARKQLELQDVALEVIRMTMNEEDVLDEDAESNG